MKVFFQISSVFFPKDYVAALALAKIDDVFKQSFKLVVSSQSSITNALTWIWENEHAHKRVDQHHHYMQ